MTGHSARFSQGVSSEFAEEYLENIKLLLVSDGDAIGWKKSVSANRYAYNFKVVIVMQELEDQAEARRRVYEVKDLVGGHLKSEEL